MEEKTELPNNSCTNSDSIIEACISRFRNSFKCQNTAGNGNNNTSVGTFHNRILLQGPSKSGKSSLVMDFALSLASKEPCRCNNSFGDNIFKVASDCTNQTCQNCLAVTLFVPAQRDRPFPLFCEQLDNSNSDYEYLREDEKGDSNFDEKIRQKELKLNYASKRIQVRHVTSISDIIRYLLSITGRPIEEQPFAGLIIDDIDVLCSHHDAATAVIRMSQVGTINLSFFSQFHKIIISHNF